MGVFAQKKDKIDSSLSFLFVGDIDLTSNQMLLNNLTSLTIKQ
jgi:hypothetical protein